MVIGCSASDDLVQGDVELASRQVRQDLLAEGESDQERP